MMLTMDTLNKYYLIDYEQNKITSDTSANNRTDILNKFQSSNKIYLLFSVRILDECIDIPACDSIYIANPPSSKIRTIQRLCRCIRKDKNNPNKIGNIFIWCNEYESILETLSGLKEYDTVFKDKINLIENNFYGKSDNKILLSDKKLINNYLIGVKEYRYISWTNRLEQVKKYIDEHKKRPSTADKDIEIKKLSEWLSRQQNLYNKKNEIMTNPNIIKIYEDFLNKYKEYFLSNEKLWKINLNKVKKYIDINKKRPSRTDKNNEIKIIAVWINTQITNYKNDRCILKDSNIKKLWEQFIEKYNIYLLLNEDQWILNLNNIKKYINIYNKRPSVKDNDEQIRIMYRWISTQQKSYKNKSRLMKHTHIRKMWEEFINEYKKYFK